MNILKILTLCLPLVTIGSPSEKFNSGWRQFDGLQWVVSFPSYSGGITLAPNFRTERDQSLSAAINAFGTIKAFSDQFIIYEPHEERAQLIEKLRYHWPIDGMWEAFTENLVLHQILVEEDERIFFRSSCRKGNMIFGAAGKFENEILEYFQVGFATSEDFDSLELPIAKPESLMLMPQPVKLFIYPRNDPEIRFNIKLFSLKLDSENIYNGN